MPVHDVGCRVSRVEASQVNSRRSSCPSSPGGRSDTARSPGACVRTLCSPAAGGSTSCAGSDRVGARGRGASALTVGNAQGPAYASTPRRHGSCRRRGDCNAHRECMPSSTTRRPGCQRGRASPGACGSRYLNAACCVLSLRRKSGHCGLFRSWSGNRPTPAGRKPCRTQASSLIPCSERPGGADRTGPRMPAHVPAGGLGAAARR